MVGTLLRERKSREVYVSSYGIVQYLNDPDDLMTVRQREVADKLGIGVNSTFTQGEYNHALYEFLGGDRYQALRGTVDDEYASRRHRESGRHVVTKTRRAALKNPWRMPSYALLHEMNIRGLLRFPLIGDTDEGAIDEVIPWSQGELISAFRTAKREKRVREPVEMPKVYRLRLLNAIGGLDVHDKDTDDPCTREQCNDLIDDRLPTAIARAHLEQWVYVGHRMKSDEIEGDL